MVVNLPTILDAIREQPDDGPRWLALASWLSDNGREDEAAAVRVFWPALQDDLARRSLDDTLEDVARNAELLGQCARKVEGRTREAPPDD
jgi:uncharacterized protein (TIGR02996 family)